MKAMAMEKYGSFENLKEMEFLPPEPAENEVQIRILAAGVNPVDWKICEGHLKERLPHKFPLIPGWDAAGTVSKVGSKVSKFKVGDEVYAYCRKPEVQWGTYAEYICIEAESVAAKPKNLSFAKSAAIPLAGLTAWQALFDVGHLKKDEVVLIHAGAGGVGSLALGLAKYAAAIPLTTASGSNHDYVLRYGAEVAIDYKNESFVTRVKELYPDRIDMVFDCVGGQTLQESFQVLKPGGRLISIVERPDAGLAEKYKITSNYVFVRPNGDQLEKLSELLESGTILPPEIHEMPFSKAVEALELNKTRHVRGKIVLNIK